MLLPRHALLRLQLAAVSLLASLSPCSFYAEAAFEEVPCNATPINCGAAFFEKLYQQFQAAEKEVIVMPYVLNPQLKVFSSKAGAAPDATFIDLVSNATHRGVDVWIVGWSQLAPALDALHAALGESSPRLHLLMDTGRLALDEVYNLPHIKAYVFDRKVAFVGGLDIADSRLDTPQHVRPDPTLVQVKASMDHVTGNEKPWQDVMVEFDGQAAEQVAMVAIERWWTYCHSEGFSDAQSARAFDPSHHAPSAWQAALALSSSDSWTSIQCAEKPEPARLGTLSFRFSSGNPDRKKRINYNVRVSTPTIQSPGLPATPAMQKIPISSGVNSTADVRGLRALDASAPSELRMSILGTDFTAVAHKAVNRTLLDGDVLFITWTPFGSVGEDGDGKVPPEGESRCLVALSGDRTWLGTRSMIRDGYAEHLEIIRGAKQFIYIENEHFSTDFPTNSRECHHQSINGQHVVFSGARNRVGEVLLDRIKSAGRKRESFSVVVLIPLATEPGSFYPNLRGTYCFEQAVEDYWLSQELESDWRDYFSFFFLANAVPVPPHIGDPGAAFYGIFTHSKVIVADDRVALVGSGNINDRSMEGNLDAELGVKVTGGSFPRALRAALLSGHLGNASSQADPRELLASMRRVAQSNAEELEATMGLRFPEGSVREDNTTRQLFSWTELANHSSTEEEGAALPYPLSRAVAGGAEGGTFTWFTVKGAEAPKQQGLLYPWSRRIWGLPSV